MSHEKMCPYNTSRSLQIDQICIGKVRQQQQWQSRACATIHGAPMQISLMRLFSNHSEITLERTDGERSEREIL